MLLITMIAGDFEEDEQMMSHASDDQHHHHHHHYQSYQSHSFNENGYNSELFLFFLLLTDRFNSQYQKRIY